MAVAYCYRSGELEFGEDTPEGAMEIASGEEADLKDFLSPKVRHAHDGKTLLVPGVPEAKDDDHAFLAAIAFADWLAECDPANIVINA
ncbi:host nuclease inhibitor protein [Paracoccaceae bacterium GXU_MW_L88]